MLLVSHEAAMAIQAIYLGNEEEAAIIELRRFYPIDDNAAALNAVRAIASWVLPNEMPTIKYLLPKKRPSSKIPKINKT